MLSDDARLRVRKLVEIFLERGGPRSFLMRLGIMDLQGSIDYERATELEQMVSERTDEILACLDAGGYQVK